MLIERRKREWYRPVEDIENAPLGNNGIFEALNSERKLQDLLRDIHHDERLLRDLYVMERNPAQASDDSFSADMTEAYKYEYVDNEFVTFNRGGHTSRWHRLDTGLYEKLVRLLTKHFGGYDKAEVNLAERLATVKPQRLPLHMRLLVLQGNIGCGKTTMLHHFLRISLPFITKELDLPPHILLMGDLCGLAPGPAFRKQQLVERFIRGLRAAYPELVGPEQLCQLAGVPSGISGDILHAMELIGLTKAVKQAIGQRLAVYARDQLPLLQDISAFRFASAKTARTVLVVDNVDQHPLRNQKRALEYLVEILETDCPDALGLLVLREPTLNQRSLREIIEARHLTVMHMTSVSLKEVVRRRLFDRIAQMHSQAEKIVIEVHVDAQPQSAKNVRLDMASYKEFLTKWAGTFGDSDAEKKFRALHNSNLRSSLIGIARVLSSRHHNVLRLLEEFYGSSDYNPKIFGRPWTLRVSYDEVLRLLFLGNQAYYQSEKTSDVYENIYNMFNSCWHPLKGRYNQTVPCLVRLRAFDAVQHGGVQGQLLQNVLQSCESLGFRATHTAEVIGELIFERLVESHEGVHLPDIKRLYITGRGKYFSEFIKSVIYLEHVIGDTFINYDEELHEPHDRFEDDFPRVLRFITFLWERELLEAHYAGARGKAAFQSYRWLVGDFPVCWKLLASVYARASEVGYWGAQKAASDYAHVVKLRKKIMEQSEAGLLGGRFDRKKWELHFPITRRK